METLDERYELDDESLSLCFLSDQAYDYMYDMYVYEFDDLDDDFVSIH